MTDDPIFTPFESTPAPTETPTPDRPKRRKGNKRGPKAKAAQPAAAPEAPKTRNRRVGRPPAASRLQTAAQNAPRGLKLDLAVAIKVASTLKPEDAALFNHIAVVLQKVGKGARTRVVAALAGVFA